MTIYYTVKERQIDESNLDYYQVVSIYKMVYNKPLSIYYEHLPSYFNVEKEVGMFLKEKKIKYKNLVQL